MLVAEVDTANRVATVVRAWLNSAISSHSVGEPIFIEPRMWRSDILDLINDCLHDMYGRDLFAVDTVEILYNPSQIGYDLANDAARIIRVDALDDTASGYWKPLSDWYLSDGMDVGDFPSGKALISRVSLPFGAVMRVKYAKAFLPLTTEADDLEADAGLASYMVDLPFYFAMNRLMVDAETRRSQMEMAQNHQRAQDVPPFLALRTGEWYQARYEDRVKTAAKRLNDENRRVNTTGYGS
jgi:hypothetical protein